MILPDNEAIVLFVCFYKLLFLGSDFAHKMLKIRLEKTDPKEIAKIVIESGVSTDEEGKMSDGNFLNDTSDVLSDNLGDSYQ